MVMDGTLLWFVSACGTEVIKSPNISYFFEAMNTISFLFELLPSIVEVIKVIYVISFLEGIARRSLKVESARNSTQ